MNFMISLIIPVVFGWLLMLMILGLLVWGFRNLGIRAIFLRIKLAFLLAIQPIEAALYDRLGDPDNWTAWNIWIVLVTPKLVSVLDRFGDIAAPVARIVARSFITSMQLLCYAVLLYLAISYSIEELGIMREQMLGDGHGHRLRQPHGVIVDIP